LLSAVTVNSILLKVKVAAELVTELLEASPAIVAVIKHVPDVSVVKVAVADEDESKHPVAVPPGTIEYVTVPLVVPPVVELLISCEYG